MPVRRKVTENNISIEKYSLAKSGSVICIKKLKIMSDQISINPNDIRNAGWENFVDISESGNIFQTYEMYKVYKDTMNYDPLVIAHINSAGNLQGILLAVIQKENLTVFSPLSARSIIFEAPLAKDEISFQKIVNKYDSIAKKTSIHTEIRNVNFPSQYEEILYKQGYTKEERLNILIDLTKSEEELWNGLNSKRRNEIRRAEKEGTIVREIHSLNEIEESYKILKEVYNNAKLPLADKSLFKNCFKYLYPKKMIKYFGAFSGEKLIGTMYVLCYKNRALDWYAGSYKDYYNKYPNDILPWKVFKILKEDGYKVFDFGGAGKPNIPYGVRDYKKKFGGEFITYFRYKKIHKPILMKFANQGFKAWQKFK